MTKTNAKRGCGRSECVVTIAVAIATLAGCSGELSMNTATEREGLTVTEVHRAIEDTMLAALQPTTNFGSSKTCFANGAREGVAERSCLFNWGNFLPPSATVQSARIILTIPDLADADSAQNYSVHQVLRGWSESVATWVKAGDLQNWQFPGASGTADRGALVGTLVGDDMKGEHVIPLNAAGVAMVQTWKDSPAIRIPGIVVSSPANDDIVRLATSEASSSGDRPKIEVTYTVPPPDGGASSGGTAGTPR